MEPNCFVKIFSQCYYPHWSRVSVSPLCGIKNLNGRALKSKTKILFHFKGTLPHNILILKIGQICMINSYDIGGFK